MTFDFLSMNQIFQQLQLEIHTNSRVGGAPMARSNIVYGIDSQLGVGTPSEGSFQTFLKYLLLKYWRILSSHD